MPSSEDLRIETPEQIALELPIASVGSRFLAVAIDTVLQALLYLAGGFALVAVPALLGLAAPLASQIGITLWLLAAFCIYWGYFAAFELFWNGRTPGKRAAGIRVIKDSGRPITAIEAIARNVLRAIDFLPWFYGVGIIVMMTNRHAKRLGDFVAGTLVVHDRSASVSRPDVPAGPAGGLPDAGFARISPDELALVEAYLQRRHDLDWTVREERAQQIAARVTATTGIARAPAQPVDEFLEAAARHARDTARFRS